MLIWVPTHGIQSSIQVRKTKETLITYQVLQSTIEVGVIEAVFDLIVYFPFYPHIPLICFEKLGIANNF